jgi:glucose-1-phosphate cytidylyltransferase
MLKNIKCVILAGGLGTRLSEETISKPKPMVEIGSYPILWHIMKYYNHYGIKDFIICAGYKSDVIKNFFLNYKYLRNHFTINTKSQSIKILSKNDEDWNVTIVDTGDKTMTGGRLLRVKNLLNKDKNFFFTYGDGLSDIDLKKLYNFHKTNNKIATLSSVHPSGRFGKLKITNNLVNSFEEKPTGDNGRINGGFFVLNNKIFNYLQDDSTIFERAPLEQLSNELNLSAYNHNGFWQPMDNLRDKNYIEELWKAGNPPWKIWNN